jgi:hypothetical protein
MPDAAHTTEYPAEWFPKVSKAKNDRIRRQVFKGLEEMPTGVIAEVLAEARQRLANPLTKQPGSHGNDEAGIAG